MKVRKGFVTNSSSSSFIIGTKEETSLTIESVYELLRGLYLEYFDKVNMAKNWLSEHPEYPIEVGEACFHLKDHKNYDAYSVYDDFEMKFGISAFDCPLDEFMTWTNCKTYEEYMEHYKGKEAPFTIEDFSETGNDAIVREDKIEMCNSSYDDTLGWYFSCYECECSHDTKSCHEKRYLEDGICETYQKFLQENQGKKLNIDLELLGKICINSESGWMPHYVVKELYSISRYACEHMG